MIAAKADARRTISKPREQHEENRVCKPPKHHVGELKPLKTRFLSHLASEAVKIGK